MSINFNRERFNRIFRTKRFDIDKKNSEEFRNFNNEMNKKDAFRSGITINKRSEMKQKHLQELSEPLINSLFEAIENDNPISENDRKFLIDEVDKYMQSFIMHEKNGLESAMLSYGYQRGTIITEAQKNLSSKLSLVRSNSVDKLIIRIEDQNKKYKKGSENSKLNNSYHLEIDQVNTLCLLVEAYRNVEPHKRTEFIVTRDSNSNSVIHPGFNKGWTDISVVDLRMLDSVGLIKILEKDYPNIEFKFNLTPTGVKHFEMLKRKEIEPIRRVEKEVVQFIELESFKRKYEKAYKKWKESETLLWKADNKELYSSIGHLCREAVQEFLDILITEHNLMNEYPEKTKLKNRLEGILRKRKSNLGKTLPVFYNSLLSYWDASVDLIQRQEHSGLNEREEVSFDDAKRVVFHTAVLFYDISILL